MQPPSLFWLHTPGLDSISVVGKGEMSFIIHPRPDAGRFVGTCFREMSSRVYEESKKPFDTDTRPS